MTSDIITFKGSHYDFGFYQGELLKNSLLLFNRQKQRQSMRKEMLIEENSAMEILQTYAPRIMEEINGLADALEWPIADAIRDFGGYYLEYVRSGCSILTSSTFMVRNYDSAPQGYEGRFVLYAPSDGGLATIGPSMQITGRTDGMNEKGLVMGYNFINRRNSADGFICNMVGRLLLENCATIEEAIDLLKELPHRRSFSYVLSDMAGKNIVAEVSPREVVVRDASVSTNHFAHLTQENRYQSDDSIRRETVLLSKKNQLAGVYEAFRLLNDSDAGIFSTKYSTASGTLHTSLYLPETLDAGIALGPDREPFIIPFKRWIEGEPLYAKRINGWIDTKYPFPHMEEEQ